MNELSAYLDKMKDIQENVLNFIEDESNSDANYNSLVRLLSNLLNQYGDQQLKPILYIILKVSNNHRRSPTFFPKIERIILYFKDKIKQTFSNQEIFDFIKSSKRIILFFIRKKMMIIDESILRIISGTLYSTSKYSEYFSPEIGLIEKDDTIKSIENFEKKRIIGKNRVIFEN